jgi:c(7)-type cytochrome triheme protein
MRATLLLSSMLASNAAALGGAPPEATAGQPRSAAVYPEQRIALRFSHRMHLAKGAKCIFCHGAAQRSDSPADRLVPKEERCARCHEIEEARAGTPTDPPSACQVCHPGFDFAVHRAPEPSLFPRAALRFSHAKHLSRGTECAACHGSYEKVDLATRAQLPKMANCLACHDGRKAPASCETCHLPALDGRGARIATSLPGGTLRPGPGNPLGLDHGPGFERAHGLIAAGRREQCLACHAERDCRSCHDATRKPEAIHPGDFISTHPVPARANQPNCSACHRLQTFCAACHERAGVGANADPAFQVPGHRVHPPDWLTSGPGHHGVQAARNIGQCASCHREDQCLQCHATTSVRYPGGIRPHPPDFASRCRDLVRKNDRACAKCHLPGDPSLARCR